MEAKADFDVTCEDPFDYHGCRSWVVGRDGGEGRVQVTRVRLVDTLSSRVDSPTVPTVYLSLSGQETLSLILYERVSGSLPGGP